MAFNTHTSAHAKNIIANIFFICIKQPIPKKMFIYTNECKSKKMGFMPVPAILYACACASVYVCGFIFNDGLACDFQNSTVLTEQLNKA